MVRWLYLQKHKFNQLLFSNFNIVSIRPITLAEYYLLITLIAIGLWDQWHRLEDHIVNSDMFLYNRHIYPWMNEICIRCICGGSYLLTGGGGLWGLPSWRGMSSAAQHNGHAGRCSSMVGAEWILPEHCFPLQHTHTAHSTTACPVRNTSGSIRWTNKMFGKL